MFSIEDIVGAIKEQFANGLMRKIASRDMIRALEGKRRCR